MDDLFQAYGISPLDKWDLFKAHGIEPKNAAAEETGGLEALLISAGRGTDKLVNGVAQGLLGASSAGGVFPFAAPGMGATDKNHPAEKRLAELQTEQAELDRLYKPVADKYPLTTAFGEAAPSFAVPIGRAASVLGAAGRSAVPGVAQAAASYGSPEERLTTAAFQGVGGALGGGAMAGIGKAISPALKAANPEIERLAGIAAKEGIDLRPAQVTGSKTMQTMDSVLGDLPWTQGAQQANREGQQTAFHKAILSRVEQPAERATSDVLSDAADKTIGPKFNAAVSGVVVKADQALKNNVAVVEKGYLRRLPTDQRRIVQSYIDDIRAAGKTFSGESFHRWQSDIAASARKATDPQTERALYSLREALTDAFERSAPPDKSALFKEAQSQWKTLLTIEDALTKGRSQDGNVSAKQFYAAMQRANPGFVRGAGGELGDLARAGRQFLPDPTPNSGTPMRNAMMNMLTLGAFGSGGAGISAATGGNPTEGAMLGMGGVGMSKLAQKALNSRYPMNQALPEEWKRLMARGGGILGAAGGLELER